MPVSKYVAFRFTVEGTGRFPVDMLRYDRCCPYGQEDVAVMVRVELTRQVNLIAYSPVGNIHTASGDRWLSFGWRVTDTQKPIQS